MSINGPLKIKELQTKHILLPYRVIAETYTKRHFDEKIFDPIIDNFVRLLPKQAQILDIGCGPGGETKKLISYGLNVTSIDISEDMLKVAKKKVPNGYFYLMDAMNMSFEENFFDGIWSARTLIHIPSKYLNAVFNKIYRILKPKGHICITVLGGNFEGIEQEYYDSSGETKTFFKYFKNRELSSFLKKSGFTSIKESISFLDDEPHITAFALK